MFIRVVGNEEELWYDTDIYGVIVELKEDIHAMTKQEAEECREKIENAIEYYDKYNSGEVAIVDIKYLEQLKLKSKRVRS